MMHLDFGIVMDFGIVIPWCLTFIDYAVQLGSLTTYFHFHLIASKEILSRINSFERAFQIGWIPLCD
jgi:hypothetical protein